MPDKTLANLQRQLREKFPLARHGPAALIRTSRTDFELSDPETFPSGGITEVIPSHPAASLSLVIASLLAREPAASPMPQLALIDGCDCFDPASFSPDDCSKLLWIRCRNPQQTLNAADLILRDGNLPRIIIDFLSFSIAELRQIPLGSWHRIKRLVESNDLSVIALCPQTLIPCVRLRLAADSNFTLGHFTGSRENLFRQFRVRPLLQRN